MSALAGAPDWPSLQDAYEAGRWSGRRAAGRVPRDAVDLALAAVARQVELRLQAEADEPCRTRCDRCSKCHRHAQVKVNRSRFDGRADFPGVGAVTP